MDLTCLLEVIVTVLQYNIISIRFPYSVYWCRVKKERNANETILAEQCFKEREKTCNAVRCWGKLSVLRRSTLFILLLNITISFDTCTLLSLPVQSERREKKNETDLFEQYVKEGKYIYM